MSKKLNFKSSSFSDDFEDRYSMSERLDDSDYSEDDPYATFLNNKEIQERQIKNASENISAFIKRPEEDIESVMRTALPIITSKKIIFSHFNDNDHSHVQYVCGRLCAKIIIALSGVPAEERKNVVGLAELFYKEEKDQRFPNASLPHIIKALSDVLKGDRKSLVELTYPFYKLYTEDDGCGFAHDYPARIIKAISNIPSDDRENVMSQITPKITQLLPFYTKNCVFKTYSDGGHNGKRKNQHAEMIETIARVSRDDRRSVLDHTFQQDYILPKEQTFKDHRLGKTRRLERSYADIDEVVLKKMRAVIEIPADERSDVLEKSKLLVNENINMWDEEPIKILKALSEFSREQRDHVIVDILVKKKRGEDYIPLILALSEITRDQRTDVWEVFEALNKKLMSPFSGCRGSQIIQTLAKISVNQRRSIIDYSLPFLLTSKKDKLFDDFSTLIEIISNVPEEERLDVLEKFKILFTKKSMNISDCAQIIQALAKVPRDQRTEVMETLAQPFLIALKEGGVTYNYQTPWGNDIRTSSWAKLLESLANVERVERDEVLKKAKVFFNEEIDRDEFANIVEVLSKIPPEERSSLVLNAFLKNRNVHDRIDLLTALSKISREQRTDVLETFEVFLNQKFMKSYSGYHDAKIIDALAKIPGEQRLNIIINSLPILVSKNERNYYYETLEEQNLRIIESVAEISAKERDNVVFQALRLCTEEKDSRSLVIIPVSSAPQIRMPSNPRPIILSSLAKVKAEERNDLIRLVRKFQIKKHGDGYTALIIREISCMPVEKRESAIAASKLGEKQHIRHSAEESRKAFKNGFESYVEYLLKSTFCELFRLKIISAVSGIPEDDKRKLSQYTEQVFVNMPESDVGDILIEVGHTLSRK